jgi:hypothetical protein
MSLAEYWGWNQFVALEPFLPERVDLAGALVSTTMANIHRGKNGVVRKLEDFMLIQRVMEKQTTDSLDREELHIRATIVSLGGKVT